MGSVENRKAFVAHGEAAIACLRDLGLGLCTIPDFPDYYYPDAPGSSADGRYLEPLPFPASRLGDWEKRTIVGQGAMTTPHGGRARPKADLAEIGRAWCRERGCRYV